MKRYLFNIDSGSSDFGDNSNYSGNTIPASHTLVGGGLNPTTTTSWYDYLNPAAWIDPLKQAFSWLGEKLNGVGSGDSDIDKAVSKLWDDYTGKSQITLQNELNRQMAEEEYQRNLQSIGDTAAAYEAAGFNRNILYGGSNGSPVGYSAPSLQAYSGSAKLDTILSRVGKVLGIIPALYQSTAALEGIDQAREKTKQSEIKTMALGLDLFDKAYRNGATQAKYSGWIPQLAKDWFSSKRHFNDFEDTSTLLPIMQNNSAYSRYQSAAARNQFDLLESIGIKNSLSKTRNSYLGYQYDLDRRFGAAGRMIGMASQGIGSASNLLKSVGSLKKPTNYDRIYYPSGYSQVYH